MTRKQDGVEQINVRFREIEILCKRGKMIADAASQAKS